MGAVAPDLLPSRGKYDHWFSYARLSPRHRGTHRVLMASDSPRMNRGRSVDDIRSLGLSKEDEEMILGGNARRLLKL